MLRRSPSLVFLGLALASLNGCYGHTRLHSRHHHHGTGDLAIAAGIQILASIAMAAEQEHVQTREPQPLYYQPVSYVNVPPTLPASRRDRVDDRETIPDFDAKSARVALGAVDLSACRDEGAPRGYGHAKVTFNPDGGASKVVVDTPNGLSAAAVKCIGDRLGAVTVPVFRGSYVTVGTTWFVP